MWHAWYFVAFEFSLLSYILKWIIGELTDKPSLWDWTHGFRQAYSNLHSRTQHIFREIGRKSLKNRPCCKTPQCLDISSNCLHTSPPRSCQVLTGPKIANRSSLCLFSRTTRIDSCNPRWFQRRFCSTVSQLVRLLNLSFPIEDRRPCYFPLTFDQGVFEINHGHNSNPGEQPAVLDYSNGFALGEFISYTQRTATVNIQLYVHVINACVLFQNNMLTLNRWNRRSLITKSQSDFIGRVADDQSTVRLYR